MLIDHLNATDYPSDNYKAVPSISPVDIMIRGQFLYQNEDNGLTIEYWEVNGHVYSIDVYPGGYCNARFVR